MAKRADGEKRISFLCDPELLPYINDAPSALDRTQSGTLNYFLAIALGLVKEDIDLRFFRGWLAKMKDGVDHKTETWLRRQLRETERGQAATRKEGE